MGYYPMPVGQVFNLRPISIGLSRLALHRKEAD